MFAVGSERESHPQRMGVEIDGSLWSVDDVRSGVAVSASSRRRTRSSSSLGLPRVESSRVDSPCLFFFFRSYLASQRPAVPYHRDRVVDIPALPNTDGWYDQREYPRWSGEPSG